jgi:hypothetical protein
MDGISLNSKDADAGPAGAGGGGQPYRRTTAQGSASTTPKAGAAGALGKAALLQCPWSRSGGGGIDEAKTSAAEELDGVRAWFERTRDR